MYNDELCHYGVKGMKWGVRRAEKKQARRDLKNQERRSKYLSKTERISKASNKKARYAREQLRDLKKNGTNSELVDKRGRENANSRARSVYSKRDMERGTQTDQDVVDLTGEFAYRVFKDGYKKRITNSLANLAMTTNIILLRLKSGKLPIRPS